MAASGYSPISLYYSTTASATPTNTNLVNGELALNITDGKLFYKDNAGTVQTLATKAATSGSFSTTTISTSETLSYGTANGVAYLNGSKVVTTGSALTFDGTNFVVGSSAAFTVGTGTLVQSQAVGASGYVAARYSANASEAVVNFGKSRSGVNATLGVAVASGDRLGGLQFYGDDGTSWIQGAKFWAEVNGTVSTGSVPSNFVWSLSGSEQMRLTSTGLGIGTSSPVDKLEVYSIITARASSGTSALRLRNTTTDMQWQSVAGTNAINLYDNAVGSSRLTVDSSGNLGIGTSSPAVKLVVSNSGANGYEFDPANSFISSYNRSTSAWTSVTFRASGYTFNLNNSVDALKLDSSGNLGLGVTPSAWVSNAKAMQIGTFLSAWQGSNGSANIGFGVYEGGINTYNYRTTGDSPTMYSQLTGAHRWYTAGSGTAGAAITFTQAMTLDASGNLGLGTTSPTVNLHVYNASSAEIRTASANIGLQLYSSEGAGTSVIGTYTNHALVFRTNATERARIDSSGNLLIGTTSSDGSRLRVYGSYQTLGDGSYEGLIGKASSLVSGGGAGEFAIRSSSNLLFATNGNTERARITSGGEVYIAGTTDQGAYNLQVNGTGVWGAGAYVNGSDARLKEEVQDLAPALDVIASLRPVTFRYKEDYSKDQNVQPGFIAQELQTAMAGQAYVDGVIQSGPQHLNVAYQSLIPLLTKAIQELKAEFDAYIATHP